jgi:hypothetical protein
VQSLCSRFGALCLFALGLTRFRRLPGSWRRWNAGPAPASASERPPARVPASPIP